MMEKCIEEIEKQLIERYPLLAAVEVQINDAYEAMYECFASGHKLLIAGNGGSAADADHIVGELMKGFIKKRPLSEELKKSLQNLDHIQGAELSRQLQQGLPAIALHNHQALNTAVLNDIDGTVMYAQQVCGYGQSGDIFLGISTSGNSVDVYNAALIAKAKKMKVIGLLGKDGGKIKDISDVSIVVPEMETYKIQELHLPIYHALCLMLEKKFFKI
ncbi:D-sedoheptulose-7-phosphate isomerase [Roseburia inulinivorans]